MDTIWRNSDVSTKENLAEKLLAHHAQLSDNFYGRIVLRNCNITHYRRKQTVWLGEEEVVDETRQLFHESLEEGVTTALERGQWKKRKRKCDQSNTAPEPLQRRKRHLPLLVDE